VGVGRGVRVGRTGVAVGGTGVCVAVGGTGVWVTVGGRGVAVGGSGVLVAPCAIWVAVAGTRQARAVPASWGSEAGVDVGSAEPQLVTRARTIITARPIRKRLDKVLHLSERHQVPTYSSMHEASGSWVGSSKNCNIISSAHALFRVTP
jgi:hypothetical protein